MFVFKEIRLLAGQGCVYIKHKDGFKFLIQPETNSEAEDNSYQDDTVPHVKSPEPPPTQPAQTDNDDDIIVSASAMFSSFPLVKSGRNKEFIDRKLPSALPSHVVVVEKAEETSVTPASNS